MPKIPGHGGAKYSSQVHTKYRRPGVSRSLAIAGANEQHKRGLARLHAKAECKGTIAIHAERHRLRTSLSYAAFTKLGCSLCTTQNSNQEMKTHPREVAYGSIDTSRFGGFASRSRFQEAAFYRTPVHLPATSSPSRLSFCVHLSLLVCTGCPLGGRVELQVGGCRIVQRARLFRPGRRRRRTRVAIVVVRCDDLRH